MKNNHNMNKRILSIMMAAMLLTALALPAFAEEGNYICGQEPHTHGDACYTSQLACGLEETAPAEGAEGEAAGHLHTEACYVPVLTCAIPEHVHSEACLPAIAEPEPVETTEPAETEQVEATEQTEPAETEITEGEGEEAAEGEDEEITEDEVVEITEDETPLEIRTVQLYEDEEVRITVTYDDETLPAEAVMVAEAITAETDPEAYASLVEAANVALGAEADAEMPAMFYSIRFYVGEEEVEPTAPVEVKVQFLQDSFQVEEETAVLHLDENGAEMLESQVTVAENMAEFQA